MLPSSTGGRSNPTTIANPLPHPEQANTPNKKQLQYPADQDPLVADPLQTIQVLEEEDHFTYASSLLEPNET